jgi:hypothetical protein
MENKKLTAAPPVKPATRDEALEFLKGLQRFQIEEDEPVDDVAVREYLSKFPLGSLQGIARRIMMDIMKAPIADVTPEDSGKPAQKKKKTPAAKRTPPAGAKARPPRRATKK